jgi:hypothetical protein
MHLISGGQNYFFEGACGQKCCQKGAGSRVAMSEIMPYNIIYGMPVNGRKEQDYERNNKP